MTTMVSAAESTANVNTSQQVRDVADQLAYLDPDAAPFTLVTSKADKRVAENFKVEWPEKETRPKYDQINNGAGYNSTATSLVVDNGAYFRNGDVVSVPRTGEKFQVSSISTNTLTVVRAVDGDRTTGAALVDNDDLFIIGSAYAEGAAVGTEKEVQESWVYNYTQIFRDPFGATRTQQNTKSYLGNNRVRQRKEYASYHRIHIEQSMLFGERNRDTATSTNSPRNYMGGFLYYATSNAKDAGGTLTEAEVWSWCESLFTYTAGSSSRVVYASALLCSVIDLLAGARLRTVPKDETYGIAVKEWVTSHGTLMIVKHRLLVNGAGGQGYGGYGLACEPSQMAYRYLANSDTQLLIDRQAPGDDKWTDEYLTECALEFKLPGLHGVLSGVTG
jgi:hypothetical protein